ncbi:MAG: WYL domain-containing protein [Muribaculaceae bacterium]|nr:WYL domain-containing protein [Muribaculaceae bacterium]
MAKNLIAKYIWMVDTIERHGAITRERLNELWMQSEFSDGSPLPRRSFYNYRNGIADTLGIDIEFNQSTYEYYIAHDGTENASKRQQWLLDSMSISGMVSSSADLSSRILLEYVPSAREFLPMIIDAMRQNLRIRFSYRSYKRVNQQNGIVIEPYFVKIFNQLWYVIGYNTADKKIKTYSLDRMSGVNITDSKFKMPEDLIPEEFFADCYGITTNQGDPKRISIKAEPTQAKYLRALPLHHSQQEELHDNYSIFRYKMRNTYDLRERLLSHGSSIEVLEPPELKAQIVDELKRALDNYNKNKKSSKKNDN